MIDYLNEFDIKSKDIDLIKQRYSKEIISKFELLCEDVKKTLAYMKSIGIKNMLNVILYRPDLCFSSPERLKERFSKVDQSLILFAFNNDIDDLINLDI